MATPAISPSSILTPCSIAGRVARRHKQKASHPPGQEPENKRARTSSSKPKKRVRYLLETAIGPTVIYPVPLKKDIASQPMPKPPILKKKPTKAEKKPVPKIKTFREFRSDPKLIADIEKMILEKGYDTKFEDDIHKEMYVTRVLLNLHNKYVAKLKGKAS